MARPRQNAKILELSGAFKKNPQRRRARAAELAVTAGLGDPPKEWVELAAHSSRCKDLLATWNQIVAQDVLHVLNISHRLLVENACYLMYKIRRAAQGNGKATSGDYAQVKAILASIGQTPIDSSRVAGAVRVPDRAGVSSASPRSGGGWGEYSA